MAFHDSRSDSAPEAASRLFLLFTIGADRYVLDTAEVVEVAPLRTLKQIPGTPSWLAGMMAHRGHYVPVVDLGARAGLPATERRTGTRIAVVHYRRSPATEAVLGLILAQATDTVRCRDTDFQEAGVDNPSHPYLGPVMAHASLGLVQRVTVASVLPADIHALLFPDGALP